MAKVAVDDFSGLLPNGLYMVRCAYFGGWTGNARLRDVGGRTLNLQVECDGTGSLNHMRAIIATIRMVRGEPVLAGFSDSFDWESTPYFGALHPSIALGFADGTYKSVPAFRAPHWPAPGEALRLDTPYGKVVLESSPPIRMPPGITALPQEGAADKPEEAGEGALEIVRRRTKPSAGPVVVAGLCARATADGLSLYLTEISVVVPCPRVSAGPPGTDPAYAPAVRLWRPTRLAMEAWHEEAEARAEAAEEGAPEAGGGLALAREGWASRAAHEGRAGGYVEEPHDCRWWSCTHAFVGQWARANGYGLESEEDHPGFVALWEEYKALDATDRQTLLRALSMAIEPDSDDSGLRRWAIGLMQEPLVDAEEIYREAAGRRGLCWEEPSDPPAGGSFVRMGRLMRILEGILEIAPTRRTSINFNLSYKGLRMAAVVRDSITATFTAEGKHWSGSLGQGGEVLVPADLVGLMTDLNDNTVEWIRESGKLACRCCFCGRALETEESIDYGYGPECAANLGLPWSRAKARLGGLFEALDGAMVDEASSSASDDDSDLEYGLEEYY